MACAVKSDARARSRALSLSSPLCRFFQGAECAMLHEPKERRPACPHFTKSGVCKFGQACWYPHAKPAPTQPPNLGVQVHGTHSQRLEDYLNRQPGCRVEASAAAAVNAGKKGVKTLLLHVLGDVAAFASRMLVNNHRLRAAITRVYPITCHGSSLEDAVQEALSLEAPLDGKTFRLQAFPRSLERHLGDGPQGVCQCCSTRPGHKIELQAKGASHMLSVVLASEVYYVGTAPREAFAVSWDTCAASSGGVGAGDGGRGRTAEEGEGGEVLCRAYYKLREALECVGVERLPHGSWRAIDIGASPGGWTQCLLEMGAGRVVSIDPGDVKVEPASLMPCVEHIRAKVQDCMGELEGRGEEWDVAVCDMNCSPQEAVNVLLSARRILRAGALVVITFKKFSQAGKCTGLSYKADQDAALDLLRKHCSKIQVEHLFANTLDERTVIATLE